MFTPNLILPHPAPTQPPGQRPPERSHGHETWNKRWTMTFSCRRQLGTQNEWSDPEHIPKTISICQKNRISSKSGFPPHRYYSRAWLHQKALRVTWEMRGDYAAAPIWRKNCPNGVQIGRESTIFTPNRILPHPAPTQPPGQRPPERSHGHETGNKRWTMTFSWRRQLDMQNEWSNPEHSPKTISICQKKSNFIKIRFSPTPILLESLVTPEKLYESLGKAWK